MISCWDQSLDHTTKSQVQLQGIKQRSKSPGDDEARARSRPQCSILLSSHLAAVSSSASSSAGDFDLFLFVQQWPGSLCDSKKGCCFQNTGKPAPDFGIHGLWLQYATCRPATAAAGDGDDGAVAAFNILGSSTGTAAVGKKKKKCWPEDCGDGKNDKLDLLQILLAALERDWPTLSCKNGATNMDFWGHEWEKHGTCSALDQHRYFQRSLELKAAHNLTAVLADAGIVPSDSATYFLSGVKDAIRGATGFDAMVECNRNTAGDGEAQLYQVYLCVALDGSVLVDCPEPLLRNCADKIKFPAF